LPVVIVDPQVLTGLSQQLLPRRANRRVRPAGAQQLSATGVEQQLAGAGVQQETGAGVQQETGAGVQQAEAWLPQPPRRANKRVRAGRAHGSQVLQLPHEEATMPDDEPQPTQP
jgi:hypothetical protein